MTILPTDTRNKGKFDNDYLSWKKWEKSQSFGGIKKHHLAYFAAEIKKTQLNEIKEVLEIGFGYGRFLAFAKSRGWNVIGTEVNEGLLQRAKEFGYQAIPAHRVSELENNSFDLIVAFDILEHVPQNELGDFLTLLRRKLKVGGCLLAKFPNGDSPFGLACQNGDITHVTFLGYGKVEYFSNACGYEMTYVGKEAQPIFCGNLLLFMHRIMSVPIKLLMEVIVKLIFHPGSRIVFFSSNLVIALRKNSQ